MGDTIVVIKDLIPRLSREISSLYKKTIPCTLQAYGDFAEECTNFLEGRYDQGFRIGMCVGEMVQNFVDHGKGSCVDIYAWETPEVVCFNIGSDGKIFDPKTLLIPKESSPEQSRGRGMMIMREWADALMFDPDGRGVYLYFKKI
jgi:anti-sigma regulatory factor (Ser/Thr protein kinase)